jgi:pimeloyl-ACP methyl ester carboxylesterase
MITLRDGRRLDYSVAGPEDGFPLLYFHGAIGTAPAIGAGVEALGLRYVCVNRPGFAGSDLAPERTMLDFADDVEQLADALGLERFAVVGVSAGGPYALACGRALGDRISAIGVVSSLSPLCAPHAVPGMPAHIRLALRALAGRPGTCAWLGERVVALVRRHPWLLVRAMTAGAPSCDRRMLAGRAARSAAADQFLEAAAGGVARDGRGLRAVGTAVGLRAGRHPPRGPRLPRRARCAGARRARAPARRQPAALPRLHGP